MPAKLPTKAVTEITRAVVRPYFAWMHRIRWCGLDNVPREGPAILAANHQSFYDPVMISLAVPRPVAYMAWNYYYEMPLVGWLMRLYGAVPVDLDSPGPAALSGLLSVLREGGLCGIFPEGGRTLDGSLQRPRPGVAVLALRSGAPVVPVTIAGAFQTWPRGRAVPRPGPIRLHFAAPFRAADVRPEGSRAERRRAVTGEIMRRIADGFHELGRPDLARDSQDAVGAVRKKTRFQ